MRLAPIKNNDILFEKGCPLRFILSPTKLGVHVGRENITKVFRRRPVALRAPNFGAVQTLSLRLYHPFFNSKRTVSGG
jgi:hypothetical protein